MSFKNTYREEAWRRCQRIALEAAKCVARQSPEALARVHLRLYEAFTRSLNIADPRTVADVVAEAGVDRDRFMADYRAGVGRDDVVADYKAAMEDGVRSIPTLIVPASGRLLVGLATLAEYRAAIEDGARC